MLSKYLTLTIRLLIRNPFFGTINMLGLAIGFASFIVLWEYSKSELESDKFHPDHGRIFRPIILQNYLDGGWWRGMVPNAEVILRTAKEFGEIESFTRVINQGNFYDLPHDDQLSIFLTNDKNERTAFSEDRIAYADPNLFEFFSLSLIQGNPRNVLLEPNSVVLSDVLSKKYFGNSQPTGKILFINDSIPLKVTGIFKELPKNTHLKFTMVISTKTIEKYLRSISIGSETHGYFKLNKTVNPKEFEKKIFNYYKTNFPEWIAGFANASVTDQAIELQSLEDIQFQHAEGDQHINKNIDYYRVLRFVAIAVMFMSWINYINLTLAANQRRVKELAARKTVGARNRDLIVQFIVESFVVNMIAMLMALTFIQWTRIPAALFLDFYIPSWSEISLDSLIFIAIIFFAGVLITGIYPAVSSLKVGPQNLFKRMAMSTFSLPYMLTTLQYVSAIILIIWAYSSYLQIHYLLNKNLGFAKENVVVIDMPTTQDKITESQVGLFKKQLLNINGIEDLTASNNVSGDDKSAWLPLQTSAANEIYYAYSSGGVDDRFLPFYGIKLLAGRNFIANHPADKQAIILSSMATVRLGYKKPIDALGAEVLLPIEKSSSPFKATVIGLIEDYYLYPSFHWNAHTVYGVHNGIALTYSDHLCGCFDESRISVRIQAGQFDNVIEQIKGKYAILFPHSVFKWYFLEDYFNRHYNNDKTTTNQILLFTVIAMGIACMGLVGIVSNKIIEKTKEIGIRRVLGAELFHLANLLLRTTVTQYLIAIIIGIPISYYLVNQYFGKFSDVVALEWWNFALPVIILVLIMFSAIVSVLIKAVRTNPVESLRYE